MRKVILIILLLTLTACAKQIEVQRIVEDDVTAIVTLNEKDCVLETTVTNQKYPELNTTRKEYCNSVIETKDYIEYNFDDNTFKYDKESKEWIN